MILCDPFAINTLSLSTVRHLQELVGQETLPRVSQAGCLLPAGRGAGVDCCWSGVHVPLLVAGRHWSPGAKWLVVAARRTLRP